MKVKELILELQQLNQDKEIFVSQDEEGNEFKRIWEIQESNGEFESQDGEKIKGYIIFPYSWDGCQMSKIPVEYGKRAGFEIGNMIHIDTDNKEWGRVATDGMVLALFGKVALVRAKSISADILVPYKEITKR